MKIVQKKICMLGDFAVGKTSLVRRFVEGRFDDKYLSTIGVKLSRKTVTRPEYTLNLILWDLAGGDDFVSVPSNYLVGVAGAILVCDLTRSYTLNTFKRYVEQIRSYNTAAPLLFIGNKADLVAERVVSEDDLQRVSQGFGGLSIITSAKTGLQVEDAFLLLADQLEAQG